MKLIPAENVRKFISELEDIFHAIHLDEEAWHGYYKIADLYLGSNIKEVLENDIMKEIAIIWNIEDVQSIRPDLTSEQASEVLENIEENHDANYGVNWATIEIVGDSLFPLDVSTNSEILGKEYSA
jgi:hypothetical protein